MQYQAALQETALKTREHGSRGADPSSNRAPQKACKAFGIIYSVSAARPEKTKILREKSLPPFFG
jgi:hypothetical protein